MGDRPTIVPHLLRRQVERNPDHTAVIVDGHGEMTFAQWDLRSNRVAHALVAHELNPGDRVGLLYGNADGLEYLSSYLGIHKAGCVAVPLNTRYQSAELEHVLGHCEARLVLSSEEHASRIRAVAETRQITVLTREDLSQATAEQVGSFTPIERQSSDLADIL